MKTEPERYKPKRCPGCASDRLMVFTGSDYTEYRIKCLCCGWYGPKRKTIEEAWAAWDKRKVIVE